MTVPADSLIKTQVARFVDRRGDWDAFAGARVEGFRRAQHRLVFFEDEAGQRAEATLGPWDCVSCPPGVMHGYQNVGLEPAYLQVMLGKARPDLMTYQDAELQGRRDVHLVTPS